MQSYSVTPAENLMQRLLQSEKLQSSYQFIVDKNEHHTNIFMRFAASSQDNHTFPQKNPLP